jgi:phosphatidylserine/phosphatidylglycerophosphate/cardiolipin synthase-like enzyme
MAVAGLDDEARSEMKTLALAATVGVAFGIAMAACGGSSAPTNANPNPTGDDTTGDDSGGSSGGSSGGNTSSGGSGGGSGGTSGGGSGGSSGGGSGGGSGSSSGGSSHDAGPPPPSTGVSILVEPDGQKGAELVSAIRGAKTSVHMTMYLLSSSQVIQALIDQRNNGLDVKVVLNQNFPSNGGDNSSSYSQLVNNKVNVVWAPSAFTYTHEKCVILDGKTAWIMTMNATNTSPTDNREYLAIDSNAADVTEAEAIFEADYAGTSVSPSGALAVAPVNARTKIIAVASSAKSTLDVEGEEFSDTQTANAIAAAAKSGVKVRVVVADTTATSTQQSAIATVKAAGAQVVATTTPYIHAKAMIADGTSMYVGSANFSGGSLGYNRELGVIVGDTTEIAKVATAIDTDFKAGKAQ